MKPAFAMGSFAFFIVLLLSCGPLRAAGPDPAQQENAGVAASPDVTADKEAADGDDTGDDTGAKSAEKFTVASVDNAVDNFYQKSAEEQSSMMARALEDVNKLSPEEQRQLTAVQQERAGAMSPQQAEQEARDELASMSPEQQDSMRSHWERQLQNDPGYWKLNAADRLKAIDQVRNFGKDVTLDIVTKEPGK